MTQGTVASLVGRERLAQEHRGRRRRAVTRAMIAALALLSLAGVGAVVDSGPQHGKKLYGRSGPVRVR
jgi:hypothetical protein